MSLDETRKILMISERVGAYDYICKPACDMSHYACMLAGQSYLTAHQIKILEKMGFEVVCVANLDIEKKQPHYTEE